MISTLIIVGLFGCLAIYLVFYTIRKYHQKKMMRMPFPKEWETIFISNLPIYKTLSMEFKTELKNLTLQFISSKIFEGCGGLEITDEVKITIAGEACLLLLNRNITKCFPSLHTVLVYPQAYIAQEKHSLHSGIIKSAESARLGESWQHGAVVLSWDHVKVQALNFHDGHNVVLHEFGHQLDQENGSANGTPMLKNRSSYKTWGKVLSNDFMELQLKTQSNQVDVMDSYGATNPAEFFAVATETFFEKPKQLHCKHPRLFEELKNYYNLDPTVWAETEA